MPLVVVRLQDGTTARFDDAETMLDTSDNTLTVYGPSGESTTFQWRFVASYTIVPEGMTSNACC